MKIPELYSVHPISFGDKRQVRDMKKLFIYKQEPYPKGDNVRYDASSKIATQMVLF